MNEDFEKMEKLVSPDFVKMVSDIMAKKQIENYSKFFHPDVMRDIVWARPMLKKDGT